MNQGPESSLVTWSVPQCPFTIESSARVLDEIRLEIMDAFFSLPRGGAEIGGVLLGRFANGRLSIQGYRPLECEHAFGPSFTLSENDFGRLEELLAAAEAKPGEAQPVGWYHSHTRSEVFLSEADRAIHERFFSQPWQVALVLKPHTFQPTRAGFFFREPDGEIHVEQSYREILLNPLPLAPSAQAPQAAPEPAAPVVLPPARPTVVPPPKPKPVPPPAAVLPPPPPTEKVPAPVVVPAAAPQPIPAPPMAGPRYEPRRPRITLDAVGAVFDVPAVEAAPPPLKSPPPAPAPPKAATLPRVPAAGAAPPPAPALAPRMPAVLPAAAEPVLPPVARPGTVEEEPEALPDPAGLAALPKFLSVETPLPKPRRRWVGVAIAAGALVAGGYLTRGLWWDGTVGGIQALLGNRPVPALGLRTLDSNGQLQIRWDAQSPALRKPHGARLIIADGTHLRAIPLDMAHLGSGIFTYARQTERVDVALAITESNGEAIREQTIFMGAPAPAPDTDVEAVKERDDLRDQNEQLQSALAKERDKTKRQDKEIHYLRDQLERELRLKRLEKQLSPDK